MAAVNYRSIDGAESALSFREVLLRGIASNGSLYVPTEIPRLPEQTLHHLERLSYHDTGKEILNSYLPDIDETRLREILQKAWDFPIPLSQIDENLYLLELYHGPTLAFKDVGARFMAHTMSHYLRENNLAVAIIVATSGDTGSAVAHGFFGVPNISVFVLYPSGRVSALQEQQMTTLGGNIHAVEVRGTFDDCQRLVKQSLADTEVKQRRNLTTANSINLGRLIPQASYYAWAVAQLHGLRPDRVKPHIVVPSGNIGNLTAGVYARRMGIPIRSFVAATNANTAVPEYLESGRYRPRPSIPSLSNAMDVGDPSNLARLRFLTNDDVRQLRKEITALSVTDDETIEEIRYTYESSGRVIDPHTAVGVSAARRVVRELNELRPIIVMATAHPGKFPEVIERALGTTFPPPESLQRVMMLPKISTVIPADYPPLKDVLLS